MYLCFSELLVKCDLAPLFAGPKGLLQVGNDAVVPVTTAYVLRCLLRVLPILSVLTSTGSFLPRATDTVSDYAGYLFGRVGELVAGGGDAGEGDRDIPVPAGQGRVRELLQDAPLEETAGGQERQRRGISKPHKYLETTAAIHTSRPLSPVRYIPCRCRLQLDVLFLQCRHMRAKNAVDKSFDC